MFGNIEESRLVKNYELGLLSMYEILLRQIAPF